LKQEVYYFIIWTQINMFTVQWAAIFCAHHFFYSCG